MNKIIFYFLIAFYSTTFYSQNNLEVLLKRVDSLEKKGNYKEAQLVLERLKKDKINKNKLYYSTKFLFAKGMSMANDGNYDAAKENFIKAIQEAKKIKPSQKSKQLLSRIYLELSYCYFDWEVALKQNSIGYNYTLKNLPKDTLLIDYLSDCGFIHKQLRNYEESILASEKALKLIAKLQPKKYDLLGDVHNNLGIAYSDLHLHNQSLYHYAKGLEYNIKSNKKDKADIVNSANNTIWESLDYGDEKKAKEILKFLNKNFYKWYNNKEFATTDVSANLQTWSLYFKSIYHLSNLRNEIYDKNFSEAKKHFDTISSIFENYQSDRKKKDNTLLLSRYEYEEIFKSKPLDDEQKIQRHIDFNKKTIEIARRDESKHEELVACLKLAITYNRYKKYDEALNIIDEAKKIDETFFNASRFTIGVLEATVLNSLNKNEESRRVILKSYQKLLEKQKKVKSLKQLKYADFKKFNSSTFIRNTINSATVYFKIYKKEKRKEDLIIANNLYFIASDIFAEFYQKGKYNYSLNAFNKEIASGLLETQMLIDPNDKVKIKAILNRIENNSSQHLWNIFELKSNQNLKVPPSLIQEYNQLVFERNSVLSLQEMHVKSPQIEQNLASLEKKIQSKISKINQYDSSYQKFKSSDFEVDKIQNQLSANQLMIKYIVTNEKTFAFAIKKDGINLLDIGKTDLLKKSVLEYSKIVFAKLIEPILKNQSVSSIIFIPEDYLNALAFETLENKNEKFLIQNYFVSYAYSLKLWDFLQHNVNFKNQSNQFVSFAPNYTKMPKSNQVRGLRRGNLFDLAEAKTEAQTISNLFNGKLFLNENATKNNFLQAITMYNFHHLAMHSLLEDDYSKSSLVFTNNQKVYFNELYQLNFPSKMVVLSACSTGLGTQESGEGIMSLSRALAYSGVKSSVYSLWQVPDKETSEIMISFYENLKKGQSKDEALANAKTIFIIKNPMKKHPFYWAGFVLNGDVSPIVSNSNWMVYLGIGLAIFALIIFFRKKLF